MKQFLARVASIGSLVAMALFGGVAHAQYSTTTANSALATLIGDIGTSFGTNIGLILAFLAGLIALGMSVRYFKRWIGRK